MKKLLLILALLGFTLPALQAQDSLNAKPNLSKSQNYARSNPSNNTREYYLQKSNRMKTAGWILLGVGSALTIGGIIVYNDAMNSEDWVNGIYNGAGGYIAIIAGSAMVVTSIPILIVAGNNKKKAMELSSSLKLEPYQQIHEASLATQWVPSISFRLSLP
jgi:hypothetical protein